MVIVTTYSYDTNLLICICFVVEQSEHQMLTVLEKTIDFNLYLMPKTPCLLVLRCSTFNTLISCHTNAAIVTELSTDIDMFIIAVSTIISSQQLAVINSSSASYIFVSSCDEPTELPKVAF